jgi:hypothetical protein
MTLQEISSGIRDHASEWSAPYRDLMTEVPDDANVFAKISILAQTSVNRMEGRQIDAATLGEVISSCSIATFRLGLLIGILLNEGTAPPQEGGHEPTQEELNDLFRAPDEMDTGTQVFERCDACQGTRQICIRCGSSCHECQCQRGFSPVECDACNGKGTVEK